LHLDKTVQYKKINDRKMRKLFLGIANGPLIAPSPISIKNWTAAVAV
jgi:hypothetical protein